jgi:hypothetical protein
MSTPGGFEDWGNDVDLPDSSTQVARFDIPDDATPTAGWPDRFVFYFNGSRTGYHNEYGELRSRSAKDSTVAIRGMGHSAGQTGYVLQGATDTQANLLGVAYDRVDVDVPINLMGRRVYAGNGEPTGAPVGSLWFDANEGGTFTPGGTAVYVGADAAAGQGSSSVSVLIPGTAQVGDLALALVGVNSNDLVTYQHTPPGDDWAMLYGPEVAGATVTAYLYAKRLDADDIGAIETWTTTGAPKWGVALAVVRGVELATSSVALENVARTAHPSPVVNVTTAPTIVVLFNVTKVSSLVSVTADPSWTLRDQALTTGGGALGVSVATDTVAANGSAGAGNWTASAASNGSVSFVVELAPGTFVESEPVLRRKTATGWIPPVS